MVKFDHYWIYKLSRWIISPIGVCGVLIGFSTNTRFWKVMTVPMALISLVFNPIFQFSFPRDVWIIVDGVTSVALLTGGVYEIFRQATPEGRKNIKNFGLMLIPFGIIGFVAFMAYQNCNINEISISNSQKKQNEIYEDKAKVEISKIPSRERLETEELYRIPGSSENINLLDGIRQSSAPLDIDEIFGKSPWSLEKLDFDVKYERWFMETQSKLDSMISNPDKMFKREDLYWAKGVREGQRLLINDTFMFLHKGEFSTFDFDNETIPRRGRKRNVLRREMADLYFEGRGADSENEFNEEIVSDYKRRMKVRDKLLK